jgi:hypothetical protein
MMVSNAKVVYRLQLQELDMNAPNALISTFVRIVRKKYSTITIY